MNMLDSNDLGDRKAIDMDILKAKNEKKKKIQK